MAYIHVLTPCPTGWKYKGEHGVEITRAAVETNFFPLWEAENPLPIQEFTKLMAVCPPN